jgi:hypothetical protein
VVWAVFTIIGRSQKQMRSIEDVAPLRCVDPEVLISAEDSMGWLLFEETLTTKIVTLSA